MAGDDRQRDVRQVAIDDVQVGAADGAGLDPHADLARGGMRIGPLLERKRLGRERERTIAFMDCSFLSRRSNTCAGNGGMACQTPMPTDAGIARRWFFTRRTPGTFSAATR